MKALSQIVNYLLPVFYLAVLYVYYLVFTGRRKALEPKTTWFLAALLVMHALELTIRHLALGTIPLSSIHDAFTFLAFSIVLVYMILETSLHNRGSGLFILSTALILQLISTFNLSWQPETNELLSNPVFAVHASLSVMGYTALCLSAIYALMYLVQNHNLKNRNLGKLFSQLPALSYLEKMSRRSMLIGIVLLGIGILLGHIVAHRVIGEFWPRDFKVIVSDLVWLLYLTGFLLAFRNNWRGEKMARLALLAFMLLIAGGLMVLYFSESFHEFY